VIGDAAGDVVTGTGVRCVYFSVNDASVLRTLSRSRLSAALDNGLEAMPAVIAPFYTLDDIDRAATLPSDDGGETPVLRLLAQATARNYDSVCLPLTTEAWRRRWHDMCVLSSVPSLGTEGGGPDAAGRMDGGARAEERDMDQEPDTTLGEAASRGPDTPVVDKTSAARAELWRTAPAFIREDVTVTRLGECNGPRA
jgi:protein arginine N-methyltransferase 5